MKQLIIKLDDIGRDSSRPVSYIVLWALKNRFPISIGTIGSHLKLLAPELIELIKIAANAECLEIWNHGFQHIRYDQISYDAAIDDMVKGDKAIRDAFGIEPAGFGFPFNCYCEESIRAVRETFPDYFIFETDFTSFSKITPEYNAYSDGQPNFSCFLDRVARSGKLSNMVLQAHPPRWTKAGFDQFVQCVDHLVENRGYVCINGKDASELIFDASAIDKPLSSTGSVTKILKDLVDFWDEYSDRYVSTLSNFKSYFLSRFSSDAQKNWHQIRSELHPYKPKKIMDLGSGLGNWSLPFFLSGECDELVLNDINSTITLALREGVSRLPYSTGVFVNSDNLLTAETVPENCVDFLVSANTFNYLDPVDYFRFAKEVVVRDGRMLLMVQTHAFNKLRYRLALESGDISVGAEVLKSEFAMQLRKYYQMFPEGVRHVFSNVDINRLANMFDFSLLSQFAPYGELQEDGEYVYECLLFKKVSNARTALVERAEWLDQCQSSMSVSFGSKPFSCIGIPSCRQSYYFNYDGEWIFNPDLSEEGRCLIELVRSSIELVKKREDVNIDALNVVADSSHPISEIARKIIRFSAKWAINGNAAFHSDLEPGRNT